MKNLRKSVTTSVQSFIHRLPAKNKLPFFTLSFTLAALIVTIVAVQQQQTLIQEAAEKEPCEEDLVVVTGEENEVHTVITDNPTATVERGNDSGNASSVNIGQEKNGIKGQLLVKYKAGKDKKSAEDKVKKRKGKVKKRNDKIRVDVMQVPENEEANTINELRNDPNIEYVERDNPLFPIYIPNDPSFDQQYALHNTGQALGQSGKNGKADIDIDAPEAWDKVKGNVLVAVIDSGIDQNNPDLKGKIKASKNFTGTSDDDKLGHGTAVAGIIAANTDNNKGVAGICPGCTLLNAKVIADDTNNVKSAEWMADAIHWAVESGAKVINISIASPSKNQTISDAVDYAVSENVVVVAGAGNCGDSNFENNNCHSQNPIMYPAGYENTIAVSAVDNQGNKASFSESGNWIDVAAPGVNTLTTAPTYKYTMMGGNGTLNYVYFNGTSAASPHVAGVAALLMSQGITASEARKKIENTSVALSGNGSAHGLVNAKDAVGSTSSEPDPSGVSGEPKPTKDKDNKPSKEPKPSKKPKPSCKPKKDKGDKGNNDGGKKNTPTPKKDNTNRDPSDPQAAACRMLPSLPFCNKQSNNSGNKNNTSSNNTPCTNTNTKNGNGKNGQSNTSNKESQVQTGNINDDETSDTRITINGKPITLHNSGNTVAEDINTGGQQGGSHNTKIEINENGNNQTDNQSGGNNNQPNNSGNPCNTQNNSNNTNNPNKDKNKKPNSNGGNGGGNSFFCRFLPRLKFCQDEAKRNENDKKKKEAEDKKKKDEEEKKKKDEEAKKNNNDKACKKNSDCNDGKVCKDNKCQKKDVKGASDDTVVQIIKTCMGQVNPSLCTPDMRAVADINGDAKVNQTDYTLYVNSKL